jgi:hypothetical protein
MYKLVNHPSFTLFIFLIIGLNTVTLCLDVYTAGDGELEFNFLIYTNYIFTIIFTIELITKIVGLGMYIFVKDKFNLFDAFIVAISFVEIILASGSGAFTSLRAFRLFRIFKLFRVGGLRIMVDCITKTMRAISPFVICLALLIYIFTLMGMQFFAGALKFNADGEPDSNGSSPRYNFDNFYESFLSVFIILTGENWNEMMYNAMRATSPIACVYFIIVIVTGSVIMLQLLVAIMLNNFDYSHKLAEKRLIIDAIESKIQLGKTVDESILLILGKVIDLDTSGDDVNVNVKMGKKKIAIKSKI